MAPVAASPFASTADLPAGPPGTGRTPAELASMGLVELDLTPLDASLEHTRLATRGAPGLDARAVDAAVEDAILELTELAPADEPAHGSMLDLLDRRGHGELLSAEAERKWASHGVLQEPYRGRHPFWVRDHDGALLGPLGWETASSIARAELDARVGDRALISADQRGWVSLNELAELAGMESLLRDPEAEAPAPGAVQGSLDQQSITALLGQLDHRSATGVLLVSERSHRGSDFRELHIASGAPVYVFASDPRMQLPELLVAKKLVPPALLAEAVHAVVRERRPLLEVANERLATDLGRYRAMFMKERLLDLFARNAGAFSFDGRARPLPLRPFARSLLQLLPELVHRTASTERLRMVLAGFYDLRLAPTGHFEDAIGRMGLTPTQAASAYRLAQGETLTALMSEHPEQLKLHLTIAYVFLETQLLTPR
jgi:hypothetical protein